MLDTLERTLVGETDTLRCTSNHTDSKCSITVAHSLMVPCNGESRLWCLSRYTEWAFDLIVDGARCSYCHNVGCIESWIVVPV